MAIASTYFIKAQIPGADIGRLLELYEREILEQGAGETAIRENMVEFSGTAAHTGQYGRKFAGFSEGQLIIEETETTFEVRLEAGHPKWMPLFDVYFETVRNDLERELQG